MGRDTSESDSDLSSCHKTSGTDFEEHIQRRKSYYNKPKNHKCNFEGCGKSFCRPWKLQAHRSLHEGQRPFVCSYDGCSKAYTNSSHLKRHIKVTHEKSQIVNLFRCPEQGCEAVLQTRQCLKKHIKRRHTDLPYECPECKAKFKRNHQLKEHTFIHTGVHPFVCEKCNKGFRKIYDLKKHQRCHRTYTCGLQNCSITFPSMSLYRKHMATVHKTDYVCAMCSKKFTTRSNLKAHLCTHMDLSETWECPHENCETAFSQERYLNQHLENVHDIHHQYKCPVEDCQKVFKWKRSLFHHVKLHSIKKSKKTRKAQKERKDIGQPKKSMAAELANVTLLPHTHKEVISKGQETFFGTCNNEMVFEGISVSDSEELERGVLKSDVISPNSDKVDTLLVGEETYYRVENISIEIVSECNISENNMDCDENVIQKTKNLTPHQTSLENRVKDNVICDIPVSTFKNDIDMGSEPVAGRYPVGSTPNKE